MKKVKRIILLKSPLIKLIYQDGSEEVKTARGLLMRPWGIKASLEGRKTQTRRLNRNYDNVGDLFYMKEPFYCYPSFKKVIRYKRDLEYLELDKDIIKWKSSIHMPREAARYWFLITGKKREHIQDISEEDSKAEGVPSEFPMDKKWCPVCFGDGLREYISLAGASEIDCEYCDTVKKRYLNVWDEINANRKDKDGKVLPYSWRHNPIVSALTYKHIFTGRGENEKT